jgi:dihydrodipicolinate synthase/N-acetylneuraminate lyase
VVIHIGAESLVDARELAAHAESIGADAIASLAPSYFRPATVEALVDFLAEVAAAAPKTPFYYYHFPGMNHVTFKTSAVLLAARKSGKIPTLKGAKFTDIDTEDEAICIGEGFEIWTGMGLQMGLATLAIGAHGFFAFSYQVASFKKVNRKKKEQEEQEQEGSSSSSPTSSSAFFCILSSTLTNVIYLTLFTLTILPKIKSCCKPGRRRTWKRRTRFNKH